MNSKHAPDTSKFWVVLPTYCEAENLPKVLDRLAGLGLALNILVVDDDSPDGTGDIAASYAAENTNIRLLRRKGKAGLGSAYLEGFAIANDEGAEAIVAMDSDLSHQPEELPMMFDLIGGAGLVVGSRYIPGGRIVNWPARRRFLSAAANWFVRILFRLPISDCTSGFRVYSREVVEDIVRLKPSSPGYSFQVEALKIASAGTMPVIEFPICFVERTSGKSKMGWHEIVYGAWQLLSLRVGMITGGRIRTKQTSGIKQ